MAKAKVLDIEAIRGQLQSGGEARMALTALRKAALTGLDFSVCGPELLNLLKTSGPEDRSLVLKLADNILKGLYGNRLAFQSPMLRLQVDLYLQAMQDPLALIRKAGIYGLRSLTFQFREKGPESWLFGPEILAAAAALVGDCGCDTDPAQNGHPLTLKGTLTIAEQAMRVLSDFPSKADYSPAFYEIIPGLERLHVYISNGLIDPIYGGKLIDHLVEVNRSLIEFYNTPLPASQHADVYPNWLAELLSFCNDPQFHCIPDAAIRALQRPVVNSRRTMGALLHVLEHSDDFEVKALVLRLMQQKLERGESLSWCQDHLQSALTTGRLEGQSIPAGLLS